MPVEELRVYRGTNPRPADFDDYWRKASGELDALEPNVRLEPAEFQTPHVQCDHLWFTGTGGARVYAKLLRPRGDPAASEATSTTDTSFADSTTALRSFSTVTSTWIRLCSRAL
jgi:cephalosporin-C deacetylase-like acetyl esterase